MKKTDDEFTVLWQEADSLDAAAKAVGMDKVAASRKASYMRGKKVPLKKFKEATRQPMDSKRLAALAKRSLRG